MRSATKYILVAALMWSAAAQAQDRPAGSSTEVVDEHMDRIARIANKFKGSIFLFDQSVAPSSFPGAQLSQIPSYQWWFSFRPRYYIKPNLSLRVRMDLTTEWFNDGGAGTTFVREGQFGDLWTDLAYNPPTFWGIVPTVALRAVWGTSKEAISNTDIVNIGPTAGLVRDFSTKKAGEFELSLSMYGLYHFVNSTTAGQLVGANQSYDCSTVGDLAVTSCTTAPGAPQNVQFNLVTFLAAKWSPLKQFSLSLTYAVLESWAYNTPDISINGQPVARSPGDTRFRQSGWFIADIDYEPRDWITLSLGYYCLRPVLDDNGTYGDPFYKAGGNTRIFLTTTFNLDRVYDAAARRAQRGKVAESSPTGASFAWSR
jgi:hypothetical protein